MTELMVWLLIAGLIVGIVIAAWQLFLFLAAVALVLWALSKAVKAAVKSLRRRRGEKQAIITRAERQHQLIMSGDDVGGTYGDYLPPPSLR